MNLRSYMRGLGLGIMVCAILLSLSNSKRNRITDAQIKARAAELGMVEDNSSVLTSLVDEVKSEDTSKEVKEVTASSDSMGDIFTENIVEMENTESTVDTESTDPVDFTESKPELTEKDVVADDAPKDYPTEGSNVKKLVMVTVYPGEGSYTISKKLANLGLVESADVFDNYLCQNGYDKRLCTGNYNLMVGDSAESIAKKLTGQ